MGDTLGGLWSLLLLNNWWFLISGKRGLSNGEAIEAEFPLVLLASVVSKGGRFWTRVVVWVISLEICWCLFMCVLSGLRACACCLCVLSCVFVFVLVFFVCVCVCVLFRPCTLFNHVVCACCLTRVLCFVFACVVCACCLVFFCVCIYLLVRHCVLFGHVVCACYLTCVLCLRVLSD